MKSALIITLASICLNVNSQVNYQTLDFNSTSGILMDEGQLFNDPNSGIGGYEVPKGSGKNCIYTASFWMAGIDENGIMRNACTRYNSGRDFFSGPFSSTASYNDPSYLSAYSDAIWTVTKNEIDDYILNYSQVGYIIPSSIIAWPGNGILTLGISQNLAPFVDLNGNNLYEPSLGDYPDIRGDEASYIIMNDVADVHSESNGEPLGIEVHVMAYQFSSNDYIDTTTFLNIRVFNKGIHTYSNFKTGFYLDADIGNFDDDYFGSDSSRNLIYTYNADNFDELAIGYGSNPPCIGVVSLSHSMNVAGYYTSQAQFPYNDPTFSTQFWNFMNGKWANGSQWYYGGAGYAGSVGVTNSPTKYMFSGNPYTGTGWSEITNMNPPGDRRMFMVLDSLQLNPTEEKCMDIAILYNRQGNNLENVQGIMNISDSVKLFYENQLNFNCSQVTAAINENTVENFTIYPNPNNGNFTIKPSEKMDAFELVISDPSGRILQRKKCEKNETVSVTLEDYQGICFVSVIGKDQTTTQKVVIQ